MNFYWTEFQLIWIRTALIWIIIELIWNWNWFEFEFWSEMAKKQCFLQARLLASPGQWRHFVYYMYIIPKWLSGFHDDAHVEIFLKPSWIFEKIAFFSSCFSAFRPPRRFFVRVTTSWYWELKFNLRYGSHLGFFRKWKKM